MTCSEFTEFWHTILDDPENESRLVAALEEHAASCPLCAEIGEGFQVLRVELARTRPRMTPSPGFTDRVLAGVRSDQARRVDRPIPAWGARVALAASLLIAGVALVWAVHDRQKAVPFPSSAMIAEDLKADGSTRSLQSAMADYAAGTLSLARETSAPAAKVGVAALRGPAIAAERPLETAPSPAVPDETAVIDASTHSGPDARPLENSFRSAFSFLMPPKAGLKSPVPEGPL